MTFSRHRGPRITGPGQPAYKNPTGDSAMWTPPQRIRLGWDAILTETVVRKAVLAFLDGGKGTIRRPKVEISPGGYHAGVQANGKARRSRIKAPVFREVEG